MISVEAHEQVLQAPGRLFSPVLHDSTIYLACDNGEIFRLAATSQPQIQFKCTGQPSSLAFDEARNCFYVGDLANQSVLAYTQDEEEATVLVKDYEGVPLLGPSALVLAHKTGNVYFTDSGVFGEGQQKNGSVFMIDIEGESIRPLSLRCLAQPSGLALSANEKVLYVSETGENRILRYYQSPQGIFYSSAFHQFTGRYGPTAIALDNKGVLYVALFEFKPAEGLIAMVSSSGELISKVKLPQIGPEIRSITLAPEEATVLYITEQNVCHKVELGENKKQEKSQPQSEHAYA